jgi:hypothetical protein
LGAGPTSDARLHRMKNLKSKTAPGKITSQIPTQAPDGVLREHLHTQNRQQAETQHNAQ